MSAKRLAIFVTLAALLVVTGIGLWQPAAASQLAATIRTFAFPAAYRSSNSGALLSARQDGAGSMFDAMDGSTSEFTIDQSSSTTINPILVNGSTDAYQLSVKAASTQSTPPVVVKNSSGTPVASISNAGAVVAGAGTFSGALVPTGGLGAAGGFSASPRNVNTCARPAIVSTDGTDATPSTTEAYIAEVFVPSTMTVTGIAIFNGSDVTGNLIAGLYDSAGSPVSGAATASTAGSGADAYQKIPFTPGTVSVVGPATYYIVSEYSSATARYNALTVGTCGASKKTSTVYGTLPTTITAPTTFTTALGNIASLY